jgi:hypothetical protein
LQKFDQNQTWHCFFRCKVRRSIFARRPTGADVPSALLKIRGGKHDDLLQGQFHPGKPRPANLLIGYAHRQQTIIYGKLAKLIGFDGVGVQMPHRLGASCSGARNGLPGLTSIVVKEDIGLPREGTPGRKHFRSNRRGPTTRIGMVLNR